MCLKCLSDTVLCSFNSAANASRKHLWLIYAWRQKGGGLAQAEKSQERKDHHTRNFFIRQHQNGHMHRPWFVVHKMDLPTVFPCSYFWEQLTQRNWMCSMFYHSAYFLRTYVFTSQTEAVILPLSFVIRICNNATLLTLLTNHWVYWAKGTTLTTPLW